MSRHRSSGAALAACLALMACSNASQDCADLTPPQRDRVKFENRYVNYTAYEGVDLYRLYRTEAGGGGEVPLATFDSIAGKRYTPDFNKAACELAARTMQAEDDYNRRYWCELSLGSIPSAP